MTSSPYTKITLFAIFFNPIFLIGLLILLFITHTLKSKWHIVPTVTAILAIMRTDKMVEYSSCINYALSGGKCPTEQTLFWITVIDLFLLSIITVTYSVIITKLREVETNKLEDAISDKQEDFIKNPNAALEKKPKIVEAPKSPCPHCKAENGLDAKRCFICGKELNNPQEK